MHWLPSLREASNDEVLSFVEQEGIFPASGEPVPVEFCRMRAFDGYNIPHWRVPFQGELGILGTLCYFDL
jgi:hypothetical protein